MWTLRKMRGLISEVRRLPRLTVRMSGGDEASRAFHQFTRRHPRYLFIPNKSWGVGLLKLPDSFAEYLRGRQMQAVRTNRTRALTAGFSFRKIEALEHFEAVCEVNESMSRRQGREIAASYLDREKVRAHCTYGDVYAVLNREGRLRAYAHVVMAGDVAVVSRLLGHGEDLDKGIMYLCLTEIVRSLTEVRETLGAPAWLMYDTFFGAEPGLRYFKERLGFKPYRVNWIWDPRVTG